MSRERGQPVVSANDMQALIQHGAVARVCAKTHCFSFAPLAWVVSQSFKPSNAASVACSSCTRHTYV